MKPACAFALLFTTVFTAFTVTQAWAGVTYDLGPETPVLDDAFYAGQPEDGSDVGGRLVSLCSLANNGHTMAVWGTSLAGTTPSNVFLVELGQPSSWYKLTANIYIISPRPMTWTPDDSAILVNYCRVPVATGEMLPFEPLGYPVDIETTITRLPSNNWLFTGYSSEILAVPILPNGDPDPAREEVFVTDWATDTDWPCVTADGSALCFSDYHTSGNPAICDWSDVYVLRNLSAILAAEKKPGTKISSLAPTSFSSECVIPIRTTETAYVACDSTFSSDNSLVLYMEDANGKYQGSWPFESVPYCDFNIMISRADGTGEDICLDRTGNQLDPVPMPGGTRVLYCRNTEGMSFRAFASTLEVTSEVTGDPVEGSETEILTTAPQEISDASGTVVTIAAETTVTFPSTERNITITTPIDPVTEPELPEGVEGIPVVRDFQPDGITFDPPITITITYSDGEVAVIGEENLNVYLYNPGTGLYEEVTTIVGRDTVNNTISFTVTHMSRYGLGGTPPTLPLTVPWIIAGALLLAGGIKTARRKR